MSKFVIQACLAAYYLLLLWSAGWLYVGVGGCGVLASVGGFGV